MGLFSDVRVLAWVILPALLVDSAVQAEPVDLDRLVPVCDSCHGVDGNSRSPLIPSLAEISPDYLIGSIGDFVGGHRPLPEMAEAVAAASAMREVAGSLSPAEVEALAYYYSHKTFTANPQDFDSSLAAEGGKIHKRYCETCHTHGGRAAQEGAAILAGQPIAYLRYTLRNFASGARYVSEKMRLKFNSMYRRFGDDGIEKLVHYYASRR